MNFISQTILSVLDGGCAQGAFGCAGLGVYRSTNLRIAATLPFSSDEVAAQSENTPMFKVTPNPPSLFTVSPNASSESLIANSYETFSSVSTLLLDLSDELTGKDRDTALAIHQLSELGVLLMGKLMDQESPLI
jgi:hypothetical protein